MLHFSMVWARPAFWTRHIYRKYNLVISARKKKRKRNSHRQKESIRGILCHYQSEPNESQLYCKKILNSSRHHTISSTFLFQITQLLWGKTSYNNSQGVKIWQMQLWHFIPKTEVHVSGNHQKMGKSSKKLQHHSNSWGRIHLLFMVLYML